MLACGCIVNSPRDRIDYQKGPVGWSSIVSCLLAKLHQVLQSVHPQSPQPLGLPPILCTPLIPLIVLFPRYSAPFSFLLHISPFSLIHTFLFPSLSLLLLLFLLLLHPAYIRVFLFLHAAAYLNPFIVCHSDFN